MKDLSHKKVWLQMEIQSLEDKREALVNRIAVMEIKIDKKKERLEKLLAKEKL